MRLLLSLLLLSIPAFTQIVGGEGGGGGGSGDVTAASAYGTDNRAVRSDGTGKGTQASLVGIDDSGNIDTPGNITTGAGASYYTEIAAPGCTDDSDGKTEHAFYFNSTNGRLYACKEGGTAVPFSFTVSHATSCPGVTEIAANVDLIAGDHCHELDADTNWVYDGTTWDQIGAGSQPIYMIDYVSGLGAVSGANWSTGIHSPGGNSATTPLVASGGGMGGGAAEFADVDAEVLFIRAPRIPVGTVLTNMTIEIDWWPSGTGTGSATFWVQLTCININQAIPVATSATYYPTTPISLAQAGGGTSGGFQTITATGADFTQNSSGCAVGELPILRVERDESDAFAAAIYLLAIRVYTPGS